MVTDAQIEACLDDVQEDELEDFLLDTDSFTSLVSAIVNTAVQGADESNVYTFIKNCINDVNAKRWNLAGDIASRPRLHVEETMTDDHLWRTA